MTMNRRLIRPNLAEIREKENREREAAKKKLHPPYDTFAENYYYLKQMNKRTRMAVVFADGEVAQGFVEWYDRHCFKLNRDDAPNLLVYKTNIKYLYKVEDVKEEEDDKKKPK
jgi:sRNA-binding regulator protein Hfq